MALTINSTLGHWDQNSYLSVSEADDYFSNHPDSARWTGFASATKQAALIQASRILDTVPRWRGGKDPLFSEEPYRQAMDLPVYTHAHSSLTATGGTTTTIVCSTLANQANYRDDIFNGGAVRVTGGTNIYAHSAITDFSAATGTLTIADEQDAAFDSTSEFTLVWPLHKNYMAAVAEFALEIAIGNWDAAANEAALTPGSPTPTNLLPARVLSLLGGQAATSSVKLART